ncbi:MAG: GNAT family N-acetyltransferase [Saonia sp.]
MISKNVEVRLLTKKDLNSFKELIMLFYEVFEHENKAIPSDLYLERLLKRTDFVVYVVNLNSKLVGGLTAYVLDGYYTEQSEFFIYDIAIKPHYQGNGLGSKLLSTLKNQAERSGIKEIFVAAHEEDVQAVNFYRSTGGEAEKVIHFNYRI